MRKKYLSALLFGALLFASAGTFTSCKDYDDDINNLQEQINTIASSLEDIKAQIGTKGVTSVKVEGGQLIVVTDGQSVTYDLPSGVDVEEIEIKDGHLYVGGVDKGAIGGTGSVVTVNEDGVLMIDGKEAGLKVGTEVIIKDASNGVYTISINGETIQLPMASSTLVGIQDVKDESGEYNIFYGLLTDAVDWNGAKAVDGKMVAGMYPVLDRDVKVMLNPTGVDATDYNFEFRASDNVALWGLKFGDMKPYVGEKLTRTASESGIWVLPREIDRVDLNELNERADYITQFKENDGDSYAFALMATAKDDASQVVKSQYIYSFDPMNIGNMDASKFDFNQDRQNYKWGAFYTPDFSAFSYEAGAVGNLPPKVLLSQVIYDYKLEIDNTQMTQVDIDKYGLQVSGDGYSFAATKEAAIDNWVFFKLSYILVNGSKHTETYKVYITANDNVAENKQIGTINEAFNATYMTSSLISQLENRYVLPAQEIKFSPKEVLGANYDEWIDAMYDNLNGKTDFDKAVKLKEVVTLTGGDPINNDPRYNQTLIKNLVYFDYVDANGKSCIYNVGNADILSRLGDIAALKVYFIAASCDENGNLSQNAVEAPYYIKSGSTWEDGFAIPLNNAFSVEIGTAKEQRIVGKYSFKFQLTQPDIKTVGIVPQDGEYTKWDQNTNNGNKTADVLYSFGAYDDTKMGLPLYEAFDMWTGKAPSIYTDMNKNAEWYELSIAPTTGVTLLGTATGESLDENKYQPVWTSYNTTSTNKGETTVNVDVDYHFYGVYPALDDQLPFYTDANGKKQPGFVLSFASTIKHSSLKTKEDIYYAKAGTHYVFISNDDIVATTLKGKEFVLFDGIDANGNRADRATLNNARGFNEDIRPFVEPENYVLGAKAVGDGSTITISGGQVIDKTGDPNVWKVNIATGTIEPNVPAPLADGDVKVYLWPSSQKYPVGDPTYTNGLPAVEGGFVIQLGQNIDYRQPIEVSIVVKDNLGCSQTLKVKVQKLED